MKVNFSRRLSREHANSRWLNQGNQITDIKARLGTVHSMINLKEQLESFQWDEVVIERLLRVLWKTCVFHNRAYLPFRDWEVVSNEVEQIVLKACPSNWNRNITILTEEKSTEKQRSAPSLLIQPLNLTSLAWTFHNQSISHVLSPSNLKRYLQIKYRRTRDLRLGQINARKKHRAVTPRHPCSRTCTLTSGFEMWGRKRLRNPGREGGGFGGDLVPNSF